MLKLRYEKIGKSDYLFFYKNKKYRIYKTSLNWWYLYALLNDNYVAYIAVGKTRQGLIKEYIYETADLFSISPKRG